MSDDVAAFKKKLWAFLLGLGFGGAVSQALAPLIVLMLRSPRVDALWSGGWQVAATAVIVAMAIAGLAIALFHLRIARGTGSFWFAAFVALFFGALTAPLYYIGRL